MIRSIVLSALLLLVCIYIQSTWFGSIAVFGVIPDLSLLVLIWLSYKNGIIVGSTVGFLSGLAEDMLSASPLGFHAFMDTAIASLASFLHGSFYIDRILMPLVLGFVGTLLKAITAGLLHLVFGSSIHSYSIVERVLWIEAAYNGIIAPFVFLLLTPLARLLSPERIRG